MTETTLGLYTPVIMATAKSKTARSDAARLLQSLRKTHGAGPGRAKMAPPTRKVGEFTDRSSQACQLRIAGASLDYIGQQMGDISRQAVHQLIKAAEVKHPALYKRVQKAVAKKVVLRNAGRFSNMTGEPGTATPDGGISIGPLSAASRTR